MSNREIVIDLVGKLPEDPPLEDIARQIELLAGLRAAREQARRGEGVPAEDARKLVDTWAGLLIHDPTVVYVLRYWHAARGAPQIIRSDL
jgi:hypothetical protein